MPQGAEQPLNEVLRTYANPRLAPDGNRVVAQAGDLWVQDLARATFTRLTPRDEVPGFPVLTPDGRRVVYRTPQGLRVQNIDGSGQGQVVTGTLDYDYPGSVSADGETPVFLRSSQETSFDIYALTRDGQRFVMVKDESSAGRLNVVLNWFSDLIRLAPVATH